MTLNELVDKVNFSDMWDKFKNIYPDSENSIDGYRDVYITLKDIEPEEYDLRIVVEYSISDEWYYVYGREKNSLENYGLDFIDWEKCLSMEIENKENLSDEELLVHIMWELTFYGFSQEEVGEEGEKIEKRLESVEEGNAELVDWEEMDIDISEDIEKEMELEVEIPLKFIQNIKKDIIKYINDKYDCNYEDLRENLNKCIEEDRQILELYNGKMFDQISGLFNNLDLNDKDKAKNILDDVLEKMRNIKSENIDRWKGWLIHLDYFVYRKLENEKLIK